MTDSIQDQKANLTPEQKIESLLFDFAKRIENMQRGKTYGVEEEKQQLLSLVQEEKANELELHRGEAITGGKAGIVMSYEEVEDRLQALKQPKESK